MTSKKSRGDKYKQSKQLIKDTFEKAFNKDHFTRFIKNFVNRIDDASFTYRGNYIPDAYKQYIKTLERIGKFNDGKNKTDILIITLQKETSLERARTMQRNFIAWYLNGSRGGEMKDAALVAYVSPSKEDWRFSLVKMDYRFEKTKSGQIKVKEDFTPARRWSFLVGANEKSHTAQSRLVNILANDEQDPTLKEIEKAFDIETVTKEFFLKYRDLFLRTKDALDRVVENDPKIKADFEEKGVDTVDFAKKLLGQIVFLYFLQKKGWFGVGRDDKWGTGSKQFLRELFNKTHGDYDNFFNDILEPLFYEALRFDRGQEQYYSRFNCKIPFLNGGLFDPIGTYDWVHTDILLPDTLFSNTIRTRDGDIGDGILDVFDRYNFTVKEDEPLEKEVAIDPELLGKTYEKFNAIRPDNFDDFKKALKSGKTGEENKFNKKYGVYYTPREVVHYMCRQSLINYLDSAINTGRKSMEMRPAIQKKLFGPQTPVQKSIIQDSSLISKNDIEILIHIGEQVNENEARILSKGKETRTYSHKLPESIRKYAALIDEKLDDITVCDPAVGSGAFPVGMMNEIVKVRNVLTTFLPNGNRTPYEFKRRCIEHSLYGVDIDPGAVEIAKLRLWLSLVVDEEDVKNIKPLPNLDYRIMQGDSLISEFMGFNFDTGLEENRKRPVQTAITKDKVGELIEKYQQTKDEFLNESNVSRKTRLKAAIENLLIDIFDVKLKVLKEEYDAQLKNIENKYERVQDKSQKDGLINREKEKLYKSDGMNIESAEEQLQAFSGGKKIKPFFLWSLYFSEIFHEKGGFDLVIGNPPYVRQEKIRDLKPGLKMVFNDFFSATADLYTYFYKRGLQILNSNGHLCFIAPNKFMRAAYGKKNRRLLTAKATPKIILDFGDLPIFDATTYPSILLLGKGNSEPKADILTATFTKENQLKQLEGSRPRIGFSIKIESLNENGWNLERPEVLALMDKLKTIGTPLGKYVKGRFYRGILTGLNKAFVIDEAVRKRLIAEDPKSAEIIKPWLRGKDIKRWKIDWAGLYVINIASSANKNWHWSSAKNEPEARKIFQHQFPAVHQHLSQWQNNLKRRDDQGKFWWELRSCVYYKEFKRPKIVYPDIAQQTKFAWDESDAFLGNTAYIIPTDEKWLTGLLNSKLIWWYYSNISSTIRGGFVRFIAQYMEKLPIATSPANQAKLISQYVENMISNPDSPNIHDLEQKIDSIVYQLYELTPSEIEIVQSGIHGKEVGR